VRKAIILIAVVLFIMSFSAFYHVESDAQWIAVSNSIVSSVVFYDIDGDKQVEIVAPGFILDGNVELQMPDSQVIKYDYDGDGTLDLLLYRPAGQLIVFVNSVSYVFPAPVKSTVAVYSGGIVIGDSIFSHWEKLVVPSNAKSLAPVYTGKTLGVVFIDDSGNLMYREDASTRLVYPFTVDYSIVDATVVGNKLYVALITSSGLCVLVSQDTTTGATEIRNIGMGLTWVRFVGASLVYQVGRTTYVYDLYSGSTEILDTDTIKIIYPVRDPNSFALLTIDMIKIYTNATLLVSTYPAPRFSEVYSVDVNGDVVVAATSRGIYLYGTDLPVLSVSAPTNVFVNEPIPINITGSFDSTYVVVNGSRYDVIANPMTIRLSNPGTYNVLVVACKNAVCTTKTLKIEVKIKTMKVSISAPTVAEPYSQINVNITVADASTGKPVVASCKVKVSDEENYYTAIDGKLSVVAVAVPKDAEIPITVVCSSPGYLDSVASTSIQVSSYYYVADIIYGGGGVFTVKVYNKYTGEPFTGTIEATLDGKPTSLSGNNIKVPPGVHNLTITLIRNGVVLGRYSWTVSYYQDILQAPTNQQIIVGDRVVKVTETSTVATTVTLKTPVTVEVTSPLLPTGTFLLGLGLGILIFFIQVQKRRQEVGK